MLGSLPRIIEQGFKNYSRVEDFKRELWILELLGLYKPPESGHVFLLVTAIEIITYFTQALVYATLFQKIWNVILVKKDEKLRLRFLAALSIYEILVGHAYWWGFRI
jgi:hypothetical protein